MSDQQREVVARALRQHRPTKRVVGSVTYCVVCTCGWLDATGRERQEQHAADAALSALALTQPDPLRVTDQVEEQGAWLVVDRWNEIRLFMAEIDALRYANAGAIDPTVDAGRAVWFVPDGSSLADARGF